jgi:hypothetical protein
MRLPRLAGELVISLIRSRFTGPSMRPMGFGATGAGTSITGRRDDLR